MYPAYGYPRQVLPGYTITVPDIQLQSSNPLLTTEHATSSLQVTTPESQLTRPTYSAGSLEIPPIQARATQTEGSQETVFATPSMEQPGAAQCGAACPLFRVSRHR
jgi:hypothetical protein